MRKILLAVALVAALMLPVQQARAVVPPPPPCAALGVCGLISLAPASGMTLPFAVGMAAWVALPVLIATNTPFPLCGVGGLNCYSEYPTGANHVFVQAQTVSYTSGHVDNFDHPTIKYTEDGKRYLSSN